MALTLDGLLSKFSSLGTLAKPGDSGSSGPPNSPGSPRSDAFTSSSRLAERVPDSDRGSRVVGWCRAALMEGDRIQRQDYNYTAADRIMAYVLGQQDILRLPPYLKPVVVNETRRAFRTHVATLSDVQPFFEFTSSNPKYQPQAHVLNRYVLAWWLNSMSDLALADCLRYALACGSGDLVVEFDPFFLGGETRLFPRDPRDTVPIQPEGTRSLQDWEGLTLRWSYPVDRLLAKFPGRHDAIKPDSGMLTQPFSRLRSMVIDTPGAGTDAGVVASVRRDRERKVSGAAAPQGMCTIYRTFVHDRAINASTMPRIVGLPGTAWSYQVAPGAPLYPRGRLIVWTEYAAEPLYDGPNPFWHRRFPVVRLTPDPWPWSFFGASLGQDLKTGQDAINRVVNWHMQNLAQHVERGTVFDKNFPANQILRFDPREPNYRYTRPSQFGKGFEFAEVASLPSWSFQFLDRIFARFETIAGVQNLQSLLQLRQFPGGEALERFLNAMTPELRLEAREVEGFVRELAWQVKSNIFQYQTKARRIQVVGTQGRVLEDFDYDPGTMVPALAPADPNYTPELDADLSPETRAYYFMGLLPFQVAPGSLLNFQAQEKKMEAIQLARMGYLDAWSLMEVLGYKNFGPPPAMPLPVMNWQPDLTNPQSPPPMEVREPITIMERLIAQQQLGIGLTQSPAGRPPSAQAPPQLEQKGSGPTGRTTMTESQK